MMTRRDRIARTILATQSHPVDEFWKLAQGGASDEELKAWVMKHKDGLKGYAKEAIEQASQHRDATDFMEEWLQWTDETGQPKAGSVENLVADKKHWRTASLIAGRHDDAHPVASVGAVNLKTGANKMFGTIWDAWDEGEGTNILLKDKDTGKPFIVHTSGSGDMGFTPEQNIYFTADQSRRPIGGSWQFITTQPHTKEGLAALAGPAGKGSVHMATFK